MDYIYGNFAKNYFDAGYSVLPVAPGTKGCMIKRWPEIFCKQFPTEKEQDHFIDKCGNQFIGLACGKASGIVAIDFDYEGFTDSKAIEALVLEALPVTPAIKKGKKGWTRFYRMDEEIANRAIKFNGKGMIDVLSTGKLTVLPPSPHSTAGVTYHWLNGDILDLDREDIPYFKKSDLVSLEEIGKIQPNDFAEVGLDKQVGRHNVLFGFILKNSDTAENLQELANMTFDYDLRVHEGHEKGPYFSDTKYFKSDPKQSCLELTERICGWKKKRKKETGLNWDVGKFSKIYNSKGKKPSTNYEDFESFFRHLYPNARFDKINNAGFCRSKDGKDWEPIENNMGIIESKASDIGLAPSYVKRHLARFIYDMKPRLMVDIPVWDRNDHIAEMVSKLKITNYNKDSGYPAELIKEWFANMFCKMEEPELGVQNPLWILKGAQGVGKDSFFKHLFGGLGWYFNEIEISERKVENYQTVSSLLVANIPEFDETHKLSMSHLKALITTQGARFRAPYKPKPEDVKIMCNYVSSSNFDNMFRDSSGNRRFLVFEIDSIDWSYKHIDSRQILAQAIHLYRNKFSASSAAKLIRDEYIKHNTPESTDSLLMEELEKAVKDATKFNAGADVKWTDISKNVSDISKRYGISIRRAQGLLKKSGISRHYEYGTRYILHK